MTDPRQDRERPGRGGIGQPGGVGEADGVGDEDVSRTYREAARERAPAALDERIRAEARRAPVRRRGWQRPLALAATLALAVSLILQVTAPPEDSAPAPAADSSPGEADAPAARSPTAGTKRTAGEPVTGRQRLSGTRRLSEHALQPDRPDAGDALTGLGRASRKAANSLAGETAEAVSARCSEHVDDARAWASCIAALEAAGEAAAAERERRAWEARHGQDEAVAH
jgi:hypothetical protein